MLIAICGLLHADCSLEFLCSVLAVAEQLLISRLKSICEVVITQVCTCIFTIIHSIEVASIEVVCNVTVMIIW